MLAAPDVNKRPLFTAKEIKHFYKTEAPKIFPPSGFFGPITDPFKLLWGPKYDGKYLRKIVEVKLGKEIKLSTTLTNVVIPTFDIKLLQPTIFTTYEAKKNQSFNALLYDICIGTTAAPTYLPAHGFINDGEEFNLLDGGVAANNPTLVAMTVVTKEISQGNNPDYSLEPVGVSLNPAVIKRSKILSLGTGSAKNEHLYDARSAAKWGVLGWLLNQGSNPLVDVFTQSSGDMVDYHLSVDTQSLSCEDNYLRIQADTLTGTEASTDLSTKENLDRLVVISTELLKKPVSRTNLQTGAREPVQNRRSNEEELISFAKSLSEERKLRLQNYLSSLQTISSQIIS
ncbi:patatin-like protein 5 [Apium graveolens]|uniref:patatin-like protein 5 n=1 Tax=Apium graveolens TaxID=4045 RepID=UPI003D79A948